MIRFIIAALLLGAVPAWACPNLSGIYKCKYDDDTSETVTISQITKDQGTTVYDYNSSMVTADNMVHDVEGNKSLKDGKFKAWCDDAEGTLNAQLTGQYLQDGDVVGILDMKISYALNANGDLLERSSGAVTVGNRQFPVSTNQLCEKVFLQR